MATYSESPLLTLAKFCNYEELCVSIPFYFILINDGLLFRFVTFLSL